MIHLRSFLLLIAFAWGASAHAAWEEIERFEDGMRVYVDRQSLERAGEVSYLRHLVRWAEPQSGDDHPPYRSTIVRAAYHCTQKLERYLGSLSFAGTFGDGSVLLEDRDEAELWYRVSDESMEGKLWRIVCPGFPRAPESPAEKTAGE